MPTLNWIGKDAVVKHRQEVPFHLLKDVPDLSSGELMAEKTQLHQIEFLLQHQ